MGGTCENNDLYAERLDAQRACLEFIIEREGWDNEEKLASLPHYGELFEQLFEMKDFHLANLELVHLGEAMKEFISSDSEFLFKYNQARNQLMGYLIDGGFILSEADFNNYFEVVLFIFMFCNLQDIKLLVQPKVEEEDPKINIDMIRLIIKGKLPKSERRRDKYYPDSVAS